MAWQVEHKHLTKQRILSSAAKLFALNGYAQVSINEVMSDAQLTRGAFYNHFNSKSELYAQSIVNSAKGIANSFATSDSEKLILTYLSQDHKKGGEPRCPLAFLTTDITQRDEQVRDAYTQVFKGFVHRFTQHDEQQDMAQALQKAVLLIGGLAISRAINDEALSEQLLKSCQSALLQGK